MTQYMLMFSLGPVQPFIEQARKTRDLWLGSYLLSKLMEAAMEGMEKPGVQFVFPAESKVKGQFANLPNKYIAIFDDYQAAKDAADGSKKQIFTFWNTLRSHIWNDIVEWCADEYTRDIWKRQSSPEACFDIRWVIVEGQPEKYKDWLKQTDEAFEARKRLHNFQQREEPGEKSTISGDRQALCRAAGKLVPDRRQVRDFWKTLTAREEYDQPLSAKEISSDGSERLDAIDTIKRFATKSSLIENMPFPSTSSIATASFVEGLFLAGLEQSELQSWKKATEAIKEIPRNASGIIPLLESRAGENKWMLQRDGDCYFRATFTPYRLEKDYGKNKVEAETIAKEGQRGLNDLLKAADGKGVRHPTPYYALLKMDGDQMGKLLSTAESIDEHKRISSALSAFTGEDVVRLVNGNYPGRLVYAGGDDVLALVPLARNLPKNWEEEPETIKTVINLANRLQLAFRDQMKQVKLDATASISIAIAHHYAPLSFVLGVMRRAERQLAKKRYGRNALVVSVIRRSGAQTQVGCRWGYTQLKNYSNALQPMELFSRFYDLFQQDILSPKCVHILLEEAQPLIGFDQDAQISEIRRVLLRQRNDGKKSELPDLQAKDMASQLVWLAWAMNEEHGSTRKSVNLEEDEEENEQRDGLVEVLGWLLVMAFLTRKEED